MWAYVMLYVMLCLQVETRSKKEMLEAICVLIFIMEVVLDLLFTAVNYSNFSRALKLKQPSSWYS